jgi:hypothetical protein
MSVEAEIPSFQEMFTQAVRGLARQDWVKCRAITQDANGDHPCVYTSADGQRHCAWGWVDTSLHYGATGDVKSLKRKGLGIAAYLDDEGLAFAYALQHAHDGSTGPSMMREAFRAVASKYDLAWPSDVEG